MIPFQCNQHAPVGRVQGFPMLPARAPARAPAGGGHTHDQQKESIKRCAKSPFRIDKKDLHIASINLYIMNVSRLFLN